MKSCKKCKWWVSVHGFYGVCEVSVEPGSKVEIISSDKTAVLSTQSDFYCNQWKAVLSTDTGEQP